MEQAAALAPSISINVKLILLHLGISGVVILEELPDRVRAIDTLGQLQRHIDEHPEHWMQDAFDPLHGRISGSWREHARPSLQRCTHPISRINPNHPPEDHYDELDVDFSPPDSPINFLRHSAEVGYNFITREKTNQVEVARLLAERFKEKTDGESA